MGDEFIPKESIIPSLSIPYLFENHTLKYQPVSDASILSCGCLISESFAKRLYITGTDKLTCPVCHSTAKVISSCSPLRELFKSLDLKDPPDKSNSTNINSIKKESLLSLFYSVANSINQKDDIESASSSIISVDNTTNIPVSKTLTTNTTEVTQSLSNSSISGKSSIIPSTITKQQLTKGSLYSRSNLSQDQTQENKEYLFVKCFPTYRRHYQYSTHSKFFKTKSKTFQNSSISPNCKYFALLTSKKYEIYQISDDSNDSPKLFSCGNNHGEYGLNFENLTKSPFFESSSSSSIDGSTTDINNIILGGGFSFKNDSNHSNLRSKLMNWEFSYCSLSDEYLVISGTNGILLVVSIQSQGSPIYIYGSNFPIRCIDISPDSELIAYGITGKDRINGSEQALIVMHKLTHPSNTSKQSLSIDPITITFPYRDPINHVSFSQDSNFLSCSTALESRFLTVLVKDRSKPKLVMKSIRSLDTSLESEGITSFEMFPNNKFMCVTSVSFNAPPIIINNSISIINGLQTVAQPKLMLKLDEVGDSIHKSAISPRNDTIALLDRNGTVYLMFATKMDQESKRVFIVDQVSNSFRERESASLRFSKNGHKLFIIDRKGIFYINDFAAGLPQNPEITRCKPVNE